MSPLVSVIVPTFNREGMIARAIESLQAQTLHDIEIIVVDDGSNDRTREVVAEISDSRVRLISHPENRGIPAARNTGLAAARGKYIAWLDSDDVARPERLETQVAYLEANPAIVMVGASAGRIRASSGRRLKPRHPPATHEKIRARLLFRTAFQQSSILGRADVLKQYPYRDEFRVCEDVDMFIRLTNDHPTANLRQVLIDRTLHKGQTEHDHASLIVENKKRLFGASLMRLGVRATDEELGKHVRLGNLQSATLDRAFLEWAHAWLARITSANASVLFYDQRALLAVSNQYWRKALAKTPPAEVLAFYAGYAARRLRATFNWDRDRSVRLPSNARQWLAQGVAALLLISVGWIARGHDDAQLRPVPTLASEADEARDMFAANVPGSTIARLAKLGGVPRAAGLPAVTLPSGWRVLSSGVVTTEIGPVVEVSAVTSEGVPLTVVASHELAGLESRTPIISAGDDEAIAAWKAGKSGYAVAAHAPPALFRRVSAELYHMTSST